MGFSVSGAAAIVFAGLFLAFGVLFAATTNSFERVTDAQDGQTDDVRATQNADIAVVEATYVNYENTTKTDYLKVLVDNTGATTLGLARTDVLFDNEYRSNWRANATINDDGTTFDAETGTSLWHPGERVNVTVKGISQPNRVKVSSETGVADSADVQEDFVPQA